MKLPRYTCAELDFANKIFLEMVEAEIIMRMSLQWGTCIKFSLKKKGAAELRVVHNFILVNCWSYPSTYPVHSMDEVLDLVIKLQYHVYFTGDVSWSYWAIPIKPGDEHKTRVVTPHGQYVYWRMGMGLHGLMFLYLQFVDLVFGPILAGENSRALPSIIGDHGTVGFCPFVDNHNARADTFEDMFTFLHKKYFLCLVFDPVYLTGHKLFVFTTSLEAVGFQGGPDGIRLSVKHWDHILDWPTPSNCKELDVFVWLTPFL